jgi:hypothetical protein
VGDILKCNALYMDGVSPATRASLLRQAGSNSILTISSDPGFAENGGMIGLIKEDNKIAFQIDVDLAGRAGLKLSSKLLSLAQIVH